MSPYWKKFFKGYIWRRIFYERLTEPIHLNIVSLFVALFGSFRTKVDFDLVIRAHFAYSVLKCGDEAKRLGIKEVTLMEFGVAAGAGVLNLSNVAARVTEITGVQFNVVGFDTGKGMPPPRSYKDHPELYQAGDFPMDFDRLQKNLPANVRLVIGDIADTVPSFVRTLSPEKPIGFVCIDVDYYSSAKDALKILDGPATCYLPRTIVYLDDIADDTHNSWCGELGAVNEFNAEHEMRKIDRVTMLRGYRLFRNARWLDHLFMLHVFDHPTRSDLTHKRREHPELLTNPYL
jgi:hypothetical protein